MGVRRMFPDQIERVLLHAMPIGLRVAGVMSFAPFLGSSTIPARIKIILTMIVTALLYPICDVPAFAFTPGGWTRIALLEAALGLALGLCLQFALEAAILAGQLAGFQFGFSLVNVIDPQTNVDTPVLSTFYQLMTLMIFLQFNVHHWLFRGLTKSFEYVPVGAVVVSAATMKELFRDATGIWLAGVQIATPLLLATLLIDVMVGFLSKASPQMPAILLSIPLKSMVGYAVIVLGVSLWPFLFERQFTLALGWSERVLHLAR
jgi:flagellar biosynthesis protein FliR